jgi:hypothetical protein
MKTTIESLFKQFGTEMYVLRETGDLDTELYYATFNYLMDNNLIPYGTAKARDGDPVEFVIDYLLKGYTQ